jgi:hypothetical protein
VDIPISSSRNNINNSSNSSSNSSNLNSRSSLLLNLPAEWIKTAFFLCTTFLRLNTPQFPQSPNNLNSSQAQERALFHH